MQQIKKLAPVQLSPHGKKIGQSNVHEKKSEEGLSHPQKRIGRAARKIIQRDFFRERCRARSFDSLSLKIFF
jgi:hypothetical protein